MRFTKLLLTAAAAAILATSGAAARDRDHDGRPDNSWAERHDRDGYRDEWRGREAWHWRDESAPLPVAATYDQEHTLVPSYKSRIF